MTGEEEQQQVVESQHPEPMDSHSRSLESSGQDTERFPNEELQGEMEKIALQETCYGTDSYKGTRSHLRPHIGQTKTIKLFS